MAMRSAAIARAIEKGRARLADAVSNAEPYRYEIQAPDDIREFWHELLAEYPDQWQQEYLDAAFEHRNIAVVASRQSGKTTAVGLLCAFLLLHNPDFRIVVLSRTLNQAGEFTRRVTSAVLRHVPPRMMEATNRLGLVLPNGSMLVCVPCRNPDSVRGFSPHFIVVDEAAFVPEYTYVSLSPSVAATRGGMHLISTPNGRVGWFFEAVEGKNQRHYWSRRVTAPECPRITPEYLLMMRDLLGDTNWRQEFYSEFIQPEGAFFSAASIQRFSMPDDANILGFEDAPLKDVTAELADLKAAMNRRYTLDERRFFTFDDQH